MSRSIDPISSKGKPAIYIKRDFSEYDSEDEKVDIDVNIDVNVGEDEKVNVDVDVNVNKPSKVTRQH